MKNPFAYDTIRITPEKYLYGGFVMTLVILAAGMGSRFGGIKQLTPLTENGEFVIDFTVFDAVRAGFDRVVFIIRKEHEEIFEETIGSRIRGSGIKVEYVYQTFDLPQGFTFPEGRKKPWGTAQAIMCAGDVGDNFGVVNADDFYGFETFRILADFLRAAKDDEKAHYCSVAYKLKNNSQRKRHRFKRHMQNGRGLPRFARRKDENCARRRRRRKHRGRRLKDRSPSRLHCFDELLRLHPFVYGQTGGTI